MIEYDKLTKHLLERQLIKFDVPDEQVLLLLAQCNKSTTLYLYDVLPVLLNISCYHNTVLVKSPANKITSPKARRSFGDIYLLLYYYLVMVNKNTTYVYDYNDNTLVNQYALDANNLCRSLYRTLEILLYNNRIYSWICSDTNKRMYANESRHGAHVSFYNSENIDEYGYCYNKQYLPPPSLQSHGVAHTSNTLTFINYK